MLTLPSDISFTADTGTTAQKECVLHNKYSEIL